MKLFIALIVISLFSPAITYSQNKNISPTKVIRSGDIVVIPNTCIILDLKLLDSIILQGEDTLQNVLLRAFGQYREITQSEADLCLGGEPVPTVEVWVVAPLGSQLDRPVSRLVMEDGAMTREPSPIRLPVATGLCAGEENEYEAKTPGGNRLWRNPKDMPGYAVVCELRSVPK